MGFHVLPEAEADLDGIWLYVARESGSIETANRLIDTITDPFMVARAVSANRTPT